MNFERGLDPKEAMRIGRAALTVHIDEIYEETDDGWTFKLNHEVTITRLERLEAGVLKKHPSPFWFISEVRNDSGDPVSEEWTWEDLKGRFVRYSNKDYYIPK